MQWNILFSIYVIHWKTLFWHNHLKQFIGKYMVQKLVKEKKSVKHERKDEKKKKYIYCIWLFLYRGLCDLLTCFHTTARYISIKNKFSLSIKYHFSFSFIHEKSNLCYRTERPAVVPFKDWEDMELMMMLKGMKEAWT